MHVYKGRHSLGLAGDCTHQSCVGHTMPFAQRPFHAHGRRALAPAMMSMRVGRDEDTAPGAPSASGRVPDSTRSTSSSAAASTSMNGGSTATSEEWAVRARMRVVRECMEAAGRRGVHVDEHQMLAGMGQLEALLPGPPAFSPNLEAMKAIDWANVLMDTAPVANRLIQYKVHFPAMNLAKVIALRPQLLLKPVDDIERDADGVKALLATAKDVDALMEAVPTLMSPKLLLSVLVTVNKWYKLKKDPIEVLERDPDLIRRAQDCDVPFEPVYENDDGSYQAPQLNYLEKRTDWQAYIDRTFYGQK